MNDPQLHALCVRATGVFEAPLSDQDKRARLQDLRAQLEFQGLEPGGAIESLKLDISKTTFQTGDCLIAWRSRTGQTFELLVRVDGGVEWLPHKRKTPDSYWDQGPFDE